VTEFFRRAGVVPPALFSLYALTRSEFPRIGISGSLVSENTFLLGFSVNRGYLPPYGWLSSG
jgi:hypothetical protein